MERFELFNTSVIPQLIYRYKLNKVVHFCVEINKLILILYGSVNNLGQTNQS